MTALNLGSGICLLAGFHNLDPLIDGWTIQDGLGRYPDETIDAVTVSHMLSMVPITDWSAALTEVARVLAVGGIVRVQDEWSDHPGSAHYPTGFPGVLTLTTPQLVISEMQNAGLDATQVTIKTTLWRDGSLIQRFHPGEPHSFSVEGRKP